MKRIYISTIKRTSDAAEIGFIYVLDWDTKQLVVDPRGIKADYGLRSPLGSSHGARGIAIYRDQLWVAGSGSNISIFDIDSYDLVSQKTYKEFAGLHQIRVHGDHLYVVSTGNDYLYKMKGDQIVEGISLDPIADKLQDNIVEAHRRHLKGWDRLHFNSIAWDENGDEFHIYNAAQTIYNYTKDCVYMHGDYLQGMHDIHIENGQVIVNNSIQNQTLVVDGSPLIRVINYNYRKKLDSSVPLQGYGFTRGLAIGDDKILIGNSPTCIRSFDRNTYTKLEEYVIDMDESQSIYDIMLDPRDWK